MSQCSLQSPCVKCMQVGIFIIFYRRVHIKIASSHNYLSQILCRIAPTEQQEELPSLASLSFSPLPLVFLPCDFSCLCKNQIVGRNLRIVTHWWTLCESHLLRLYFDISLAMWFPLPCDFLCPVISFAMWFIWSIHPSIFLPWDSCHVNQDV